MVQSTDIKVLNIDGTPYAVDDMSEEVKGLVKVWNGWSEKENELSSGKDSHSHQQYLYREYESECNSRG